MTLCNNRFISAIMEHQAQRGMQNGKECIWEIYVLHWIIHVHSCLLWTNAAYQINEAE
jgi:hypothetical protein